MNITGVTTAATSVAETGTRQEVALEVQRRAQDIDRATATQLIDAVKAVPSPALPAHLGNHIDTTA